MNYETIKYELGDDQVATITLSDPRTPNALSSKLLTELLDALEAARTEERVHCVIMRSAHETVFCAGADLRDFADRGEPVTNYLDEDLFARLFTVIGQLGKPTLCAVGGHALGGGLALALACDLIVASETATFGLPEIHVGAFPFMAMALLYRSVPRKRATELALLGERLSAREAHHVGIVNRVASSAEFDSLVADWAARLAARPPVVMRLGKDAMYRQGDMAFEEALDYLHQSLVLALSTEELQAGVRAFLDRRS